MKLNSLDQATRLLGHLLKAAEIGGRLGRHPNPAVASPRIPGAKIKIPLRPRTTGTRPSPGHTGRLYSHLFE